MTVRNVLIALNVLAVVAIAVFTAIILRRHRDEERTPANLEEFYDDDVLEGRRLERALGWALICSAAIAVLLPVVWLTEPWRMDEQIQSYEDGAVERGATLYAAAGDEAYDATVSLGCSGCHGPDGGGGSAPAVFTDGDGEARRVFWRAPALNTVLLRFSPEEVAQVLNYGRPGSPMQAFGTPGGGPKNEQAIEDIIAFLDSIQISPEESQAQAADALVAARSQAEDQLAAAEEALAELEADPEATPEAIAAAEAEVAWSRAWAESRADVTDGQLLFELNCARCHTQGWSIFDPAVPGGNDVLGPAGGGGTLGFSLRGGAVLNRFPDPQTHADFIASGSDLNVPYGQGGQGSGRMPGFSEMLPLEQIDAIVEYERFGLEENDPSEPLVVDSLSTDTEEGS